MTSIARFGLATALLGVLLALGGAGSGFVGSAHAADNHVFFVGYADYAGVVSGHRHFLTKVGARSLDGNWVCTNAINDDGAAAGDNICSRTLASHPFCGCRGRRAWLGSGYPWSVVYTRGREHW